MNSSLYPVILCGGSGTRLWPLSRKSYPKQFANLIGDTTLFQASLNRFSNVGHGVKYESPTIVTNSDFRFIVTEQMNEIGIDPGAILIEPEGHNTAPAILAAAYYLDAQDPNAIILVSPSDHALSDFDKFNSAVMQGLPFAKDEKIVTFGITPTRVETGYGYLELENPAGLKPSKLANFIEKPNEIAAEEMIKSGQFLWNSGIFMFSAKAIIKTFTKHAGDMIEPAKRAVEQAAVDLGFLRLAAEPWAKMDNISIDYAVMEKSKNLVVVPFNGAWSDLGGWDAVWAENEPDANGVVLSGNATSIECNNTLLRSEDDTLSLVGIGLENIVAIAMKDAVLVADKSKAQEVKKAVKALSEKKMAQATQFPKDHRPWGWFESLAMGDRFQVKRIVVHPGASLSLQSHVHRSEHWIVVQGMAKATIEDKEIMVHENQSIFVPIGAQHRLENPGKIPMILIEIQTGSYLGEDDIVRYDDMYKRS